MKIKNIKEVIIGLFAVIGFGAIVTGFTNESVQEHTVPESHVWEMHLTSGTTNSYAFSINKVTGEVRKFNSFYTGADGKNADANFNLYRVAEKK